MSIYIFWLKWKVFCMTDICFAGFKTNLENHKIYLNIINRQKPQKNRFLWFHITSHLAQILRPEYLFDNVCLLRSHSSSELQKSRSIIFPVEISGVSFLCSVFFLFGSPFTCVSFVDAFLKRRFQNISFEITFIHQYN